MFHAPSRRQFIAGSVAAAVAVVVAGSLVEPVFAEETITLYSGRSKNLVDPIIERFTKETGIKVVVKAGTGSAQIAQQLKDEGERTPADVIWVQDAGTLEALAKAKLFAELPEATFKDVADNFKTADKTWVATSGRARVLAYSAKRLKKDDLPKSVFELTDSKWKGKIGWAPGNASFQAFVTAMRAQYGDEKTAAWLKGVMANNPKAFPNNRAIIEDIAAGGIDVGLPNHYYLLGYLKKDANYPVAQTFFKDGDIGNLLFPAAAAVIKTSKNPQAAQRFVQYLLSDTAQDFFTTEVNEFPVSKTVKVTNTLLDTKSVETATPKIKLESLQDLPGTVKMLKELGLL